jgi:hypothetical protein
MIRLEIRSTNDSIDFIEKTYRKKDPEYADFSIRLQQKDLQRLSEEWTRSECGELIPEPEKIVRLSPLPKVSIKARGILKKCEMIREAIRSTNDSVDFIEKTYRKKDPEYADFSIRLQQKDLQRLSEEWTSAKCAEPPLAPEKKAKK